MDNPAGLLRHWLERIAEFPDKSQALSVAGAALIEESHETVSGRMAVTRFGGQLAELCEAVRSEAALLPDYLHPDMLLSDFPQVEAAIDHFSMARQVRVEQFLATIEPAGHRCLEFLDTYLHHHRPHAWIDDAHRESLIEKVRDLIDKVGADEGLDLNLKQFVISRLSEVESAIRNATLTGTYGIERATDSLIGSFRREPGMWQRIFEGASGELLAGLVMALVVALGGPTDVPVLPPAAPTPSIDYVDNSTTTIHLDLDDDVVVGEVVDAPAPGDSPDD